VAYLYEHTTLAHVCVLTDMLAMLSQQTSQPSCSHQRLQVVLMWM